MCWHFTDHEYKCFYTCSRKKPFSLLWLAKLTLIQLLGNTMEIEKGCWLLKWHCKFLFPVSEPQDIIFLHWGVTRQFSPAITCFSRTHPEINKSSNTKSHRLNTSRLSSEQRCPQSPCRAMQNRAISYLPDATSLSLEWASAWFYFPAWYFLFQMYLKWDLFIYAVPNAAQRSAALMYAL